MILRPLPNQRPHTNSKRLHLPQLPNLFRYPRELRQEAPVLCYAPEHRLLRRDESVILCEKIPGGAQITGDGLLAEDVFAGTESRADVGWLGGNGETIPTINMISFITYGSGVRNRVNGDGDRVDNSRNNNSLHILPSEEILESSTWFGRVFGV